jgi:hypothetical protein
MIEPIQGDGLSKKEIKQRGIKIVDGTRGGLELHAPTYDDMIVCILNRRGLLDSRHVDAACDYLELKNAVYGFLSVKTMAGILKTGEAGFKRSHAESAYYIATRLLGRNREKIITCAMNEKGDETLEMDMVVTAYRTAFHAVFDAMDLAKKQIAEEIEKELEYC